MSKKKIDKDGLEWDVPEDFHPDPSDPPPMDTSKWREPMTDAERDKNAGNNK